MIQFALFVNRIRLYHCIEDMKRRKSQETSCVGQVSLRYYYHAELLVETRILKYSTAQQANKESSHLRINLVTDHQANSFLLNDRPY